MEEKLKGLSTKEVEEKIKNGQTNKITTKTDETILKIICRNLFTYFNLIFLIIAILLIIAKSYRNLTFLPVIIFNILIGIIQQIRSKITLDKLSLLDKNEYNVIRNSKKEKIISDDLVQGDYVILSSGAQIPADGKIIQGNISVNEALLTGEQDEIQKKEGDALLSGSFVVSGNTVIELTNVGDNSYSAKLMKQSKKIKETKSEMISSIDNIVKFAGILIIPIGVMLFFQSYMLNKNSFETSTVSMVSAVIGMIPEGLYLLTTVSLALSAMKLAKKKVLLHDMKSIETLARADILCVDKTGTITTNKMYVTDIFDLNNKSFFNEKNNENINILAKYVNTIEDTNITMIALKSYLEKNTNEKLEFINKKDFNSKDKYSTIEIKKNIFYKLGAPEILLKDLLNSNPNYKQMLDNKAKNGERILVLVKQENNEIKPILFISLKNEIRKNTKEIFEYFNKQNVEIKVISGDNPITVSTIAKQAGIKNFDKYIDCSNLKNTEDIENTVKKYTIFGRVTPEQKRQIIKSLKSQNLKVAMTGDGVNDILAMKEADCSISVGTGADAARNVSQVVLLDSDFGKMKDIVHEGRKNINNITRSACLFVYKNIFSLLLALYSIIFGTTYPLEPTQISLGAAFTIGIPGFLLTFEENQKKQSGSFLKKVLSNSLPASITSFLAIVCLVEFANLFQVESQEISTACSYLFFTGGFLILYKIIRPLNKYRACVMILCILGIILTIKIIPDFFAISTISSRSAGLVVLFAIAEFSIIRWVSLILDVLNRKKKIIHK